MTLLQALRRIEADYRRYAQAAAAGGHPDEAAHWHDTADFVAANIAGIQDTGDDHWCGF